MILGGFPEQIWRSRFKRALFLMLVAIVSTTFVPRQPPPAPPRPELGSVRFAPIPLDASDPARRRIGGLVYLGGWELTSDSARFGGISALAVEGDEAFAVSDAGTLFRFALPRGRGTTQMRIVPVPVGPGATRKANRDVESMLLRGPWLWAGFERSNAIWRYRRSDLATMAVARPEPMRRWRANTGPEAMARLADGRFIVFGEGLNDLRPDSDAVLFDGDPAEPGTPAAPIHYRRVPGYRVTDAAVLPDGRLILLNRRFAWLEGFSAVLTIAGADGLSAGATIEGRELAALRQPASVDNMEALSVTRENGRTIVWLASDDNFFPLQRTILLKFALVE